MAKLRSKVLATVLSLFVVCFSTSWTRLALHAMPVGSDVAQGQQGQDEAQQGKQGESREGQAQEEVQGNSGEKGEHQDGELAEAHEAGEKGEIENEQSGTNEDGDRANDQKDDMQQEQVGDHGTTADGQQ